MSPCLLKRQKCCVRGQSSGCWGMGEGKVVTQQRQNMRECGMVRELSPVSPKAPQIYTYVYEPSWDWPPMENSQFYCFTTEKQRDDRCTQGAIEKGEKVKWRELGEAPGTHLLGSYGG